jgi:AcrR family transcriptional regulator
MARPRDESIDRAIIEATLALLEEVGRHRLSRGQIARRAGVSLPAVNRRFSSVDAIMTALVSTPIYADRPVPAGGGLRDHLVALLNRAVDTLDSVPVRRPTAEILAAAAGDAGIAVAFAASLEAVQAETLREIEAARDRGELRPDTEARLLLDLLNGALYYRLLWRGERLTRADVGPLVDSVLRSASVL